MKLTTPRDALFTQLQTVTRAASTRSAIQALSGVQLLAGSAGIELRATDMEIGLRVPLEGDYHVAMAYFHLGEVARRRFEAAPVRPEPALQPDIEAKAKLSQNRSEADRMGVVAGLRREGHQRDALVADAMDRERSARS